MVRLVLALTGIGLALNFSPSAYAVLLIVLGAGPHHRGRALVGLLGGLTAGNALLIGLFHTVTPEALAALIDAGVARLASPYWLDVAAEAALVVGGVRALVIARRHRRARETAGDATSPTAPALRRAATSPWTLWAFGVTNSILTWTGAGLLYAGTRLVLRDTAAPALQLALLLWLLAVIIAPYAIVVWIWDRSPRAAGIVARAVGWLLGRSARTVVGWLTIAAGVAIGVWTVLRLHP